MTTKTIHPEDIIKSKETDVFDACDSFLSKYDEYYPFGSGELLKTTLVKPFCIFLAGGCSTNWRETVEKTVKDQLKEKKFKGGFNQVLIFNPFTKNIGKKFNYSQLVQWEKFFLSSCDMLVFNFEKSDTDQPWSLFELGRYVPDRLNAKYWGTGPEKTILNLRLLETVVNINPEYRQAAGVKHQLKLIAEDYIDEDYIQTVLLPEYLKPEEYGKLIAERVTEVLSCISKTNH